MPLMLASCSPQPNWIPMNPKLMFQICQKLIRGFCIVSVLSYLRLAAPLAGRLSLFCSRPNCFVFFSCGGGRRGGEQKPQDSKKNSDGKGRAFPQGKRQSRETFTKPLLH